MRPAPQDIRTYFVTSVTAQRRRIFQTEPNCLLLLDIIQTHRTKGNLELHAFVIMPDHVHLLLTPAPEVSLEKALQLIKGGFSFRLKSKMDVWERSFDSRRIQDMDDFEGRRNYIHQNPVADHLCTLASEFPFSSANPAYPCDPIPSHFLA